MSSECGQQGCEWHQCGCEHSCTGVTQGPPVSVTAYECGCPHGACGDGVSVSRDSCVTAAVCVSGGLKVCEWQSVCVSEFT